MRYPGGKGGAGVYQRIINMMPPHDTYVETHLGGGNVMERKRPAARNIGIDVDAAAVNAWADANPMRDDVELVIGDCHAVLRSSINWTGRELVYADPPYLMETRKGGALYRHEYTDAQHIELLEILRSLPCAVMISGYRSDLYDNTLAGWRRVDFQAMTRRGLATESVWLNFPEPAVPHDLGFIGGNFRERERIKRKKARWRNKLASMPAAERAAILEVLRDLAASEVAITPG